MKLYITILLILGSIILGYSFTLNPFKDEKLFLEKYQGLTFGQTEAYFKLYEESLTSKYRIQDIGLTTITFPLFFLLLYKTGRGKISTPRSRQGFILLALALPCLSTLGFVFDINQMCWRHEYPHWADSIGLPLMEVPVWFIISLIWSLLHLFILRRIKIAAVPLKSAFQSNLNPWLAILSGLTLLLTLFNIYLGEYWYAIPLALWLYYYLSLGAVKCVADQNVMLVPIGYISWPPPVLKPGQDPESR